jgi:hypothetical protein
MKNPINVVKKILSDIEVSKHDKKVASIPFFVYLPIMLGYTYLAGTGLGVLIKRAIKK